MTDFCSLCSLPGSAIWEMCRILLLLAGLSRAAYADLRGRMISNRLLMSMLLAEASLLVLESGLDQEWSRLWEALAGLFLGGGLCFGCYLLFRGGVGAGDVKLLAVTGCCLGVTEVLQVIVHSVFLAAGACAVMLLLKKADRETGLPYAPFVFVSVLAVLFGRIGQIF